MREFASWLCYYYDLLKRGNLLQAKIAQQAGLHVLTQACQLLEGQTVGIYMDSLYAFGVVHDLGMLWL